MDGTDVNSVDTTEDRTLLAASDDDGTICVYRFPVLRNNHECVRVSGHSEHVSRVRWYETDDEKFMISSGGMDNTYIQWKMVKRPAEE